MAAVVVATVTVTRYTPARRPAVSQSNWSDVSEKVSGWLVWKGPCTCHVNVFCWFGGGLAIFGVTGGEAHYRPGRHRVCWLLRRYANRS